MLNILRYKAKKIKRGALNMNIKRKILIKVKHIDYDNKNLLFSNFHKKYYPFLTNISLVPIMSSAHQLPPKIILILFQ
ncbi:hypothetical protein PROPEN_00432 [Proteus penneri ATCC 35198]|nr:hypothetical protein PROPEN_00432 [Proteus penneri ATCC 35198]